jgi:hypothetical protein
MIEDHGGLKKGEKHTLDPAIAMALIKEGRATIYQKAVDPRAHDALLEAKHRDSSN